MRTANIAPIALEKHMVFAFNDQSYFVYVDADGSVGIDKHNYNCAQAAKKFRYLQNPQREIHLTACVVGNRITVLIDGEEAVSYTDQEAPYLTGKVGLHAESASAVFEEFTISHC